MCIYCGTAKYRKIYECHFGPIPNDEAGRTFEIHHIDGNRKNNDPTNLKCVSIQEHYEIHLLQGDWQAAERIASKMKISHEELSKLAFNAANERVNNGTHPWLGKEHNLRMILNGTHPLVGGKIHRQRVENGTHPFLGGDIQRETSRKRVADGTHNFLGGSVTKMQLAMGIHTSQIKLTCPHCNITTSKNNAIRWHFDKCTIITGIKNIIENNPGSVKVTCPHCGKTGGAAGMNKWHFDKCKFRCD